MESVRANVSILVFIEIINFSMKKKEEKLLGIVEHFFIESLF